MASGGAFSLDEEVEDPDVSSYKEPPVSNGPFGNGVENGDACESQDVIPPSSYSGVAGEVDPSPSAIDVGDICIDDGDAENVTLPHSLDELDDTKNVTGDDGYVSSDVDVGEDDDGTFLDPDPYYEPDPYPSNSFPEDEASSTFIDSVDFEFEQDLDFSDVDVDKSDDEGVSFIRNGESSPPAKRIKFDGCFS